MNDMMSETTNGGKFIYSRNKADETGFKLS